MVPETTRPARRQVDGILLLDKPLGMSSNRALQRVKGLYRARKAGHTGSLDPLATGMLPICLGEATKVSSYLLEADKCYRVRLAFGLATSTGDAEGVTSARGPETVRDEALLDALATFAGESWQLPPMYSALKHEGQPLYRLARAGREVARSRRRIMLHSLTVEQHDPRQPILRVLCSKGTYIRVLIEDIAEKLDTVAHVTELRRLAVLPFDDDRMYRLEELEALAAEDVSRLDGLLRPADEALGTLQAVTLSGADALALMQGRVVQNPDRLCGELRLYGPEGRFLGIGEARGDGLLRARRLWSTAPRKPTA